MRACLANLSLTDAVHGMSHTVYNWFEYTSSCIQFPINIQSEHLLLHVPLYVRSYNALEIFQTLMYVVHFQ